MGGVTRIIKTVSELNSEHSDTRHDVLVYKQSSSDAICLEASFTIHFTDPRIQRHLNRIREIRRILKQYDVLLIHSIHSIIFFSQLFLGKKALLFQHGMSVQQGSALKRALKKIYFSISPYLFNGKVICSSKFAAQKLKDSGIHIRNSLIEIIPFGVVIPSDFKHGKFEENSCFTIGMAGRLVKQKRFDRVLNCLSGYNGKTACRLLVAGEGPELENLQTIAKRISRERVEVMFLGNVSDMNQFYSRIDLTIMPSYNESLCLVVFESLACGVPPVMFSDLGGALEYIGNDVAFILDKESELTALLNELGNDSARLNIISSRIRESNLEYCDIRNTRDAIDSCPNGEKSNRLKLP